MKNNFDSELLSSYRQKIEADLRGNILPFWMDRALDRENGGYHGAITNELEVDDRVPRSAVVASSPTTPRCWRD